MIYHAYNFCPKTKNDTNLGTLKSVFFTTSSSPRTPIPECVIELTDARDFPPTILKYDMDLGPTTLLVVLSVRIGNPESGYFSGNIPILCDAEKDTPVMLFNSSVSMLQRCVEKSLSGMPMQIDIVKTAPLTLHGWEEYPNEKITYNASIIRYEKTKHVIRYEKITSGTVGDFAEVPEGAKIIEIDGQPVIAYCDVCGAPITDEKEATIAPDENGDTYTYCNLCVSSIPEERTIKIIDSCCHECGRPLDGNFDSKTSYDECGNDYRLCSLCLPPDECKILYATLDECCCGDTDDSWRFCPVHSKPVETD